MKTDSADQKSGIIQIESESVDDIEVMPNSLIAKQKYLDLIRTAKQEIMLISPFLPPPLNM